MGLRLCYFSVAAWLFLLQACSIVRTAGTCELVHTAQILLSFLKKMISDFKAYLGVIETYSYTAGQVVT